MKKQFIITLMLAACAAMAVQAQNVTGRITCNGTGVAGVPVSDGYVVTTTDANGNYALTSQKKNGYVFYTLPRGYEPELKNNFNPQFWQALTSRNVNVAEVHDFELKKVNNDRYGLVIAADAHLARRTGDRKMYQNGYITALKREKAVADYNQLPVYSIILGDLTWDLYWYRNNYNLQNFMDDQRTYGYPMALFPVIGNHDNDGSVKPLTDSTDFKASEPWREIVSPNYYSFNLGRVHYVVLDDVDYTNGGTASGTNIAGGRQYKDRVTDEQLAWLRKDLALVADKSQPVLVCFHVPAWRLRQTTSFATYGALDNYNALSACFQDFSNVHFLTGHTHYNLTAHPGIYPNITEHNIAAICASWWWSGYLNDSNIKYQICQDGSPAGYSYWTVAGDSLQWKYKSIYSNGNAQMRIYDLNTVRTYLTTNATAKAMVKSVGNDGTDFSSYADNSVLVNVFAYDTDWKVEITEGVDNRLDVQRVWEFDPLHLLVYNCKRYARSGAVNSFGTVKSGHLFKAVATTATQPVTVKVTDSFGQVYYRTMQRPLAYERDMDDATAPYDLGDVDGNGSVDTADVTTMVSYVLDSGNTAVQTVVTDMDGNGVVNTTDVTLLVSKILMR